MEWSLHIRARICGESSRRGGIAKSENSFKKGVVFSRIYFKKQREYQSSDRQVGP
jgi:hypothetical protein